MWVKCHCVLWNTTHDPPRDDRLSAWPQQRSVGRHWLQRRRDIDGPLSSFKETASCVYLSEQQLGECRALSFMASNRSAPGCLHILAMLDRIAYKIAKQVSSVHAPPYVPTMARCRVSVTWHNSTMCTSVRLWYRGGLWPLNSEIREHHI